MSPGVSPGFARPKASRGFANSTACMAPRLGSYSALCRHAAQHATGVAIVGWSILVPLLEGHVVMRRCSACSGSSRQPSSSSSRQATRPQMSSGCSSRCSKQI